MTLRTEKAGWLSRWLRPQERRARAEEQALRQAMEAARREVEAAEHYFQNATDPELIDHAIFAIEAARRKYLYLYRQLRRTNGGGTAAVPDPPGDPEGSEWT